MNEELLNILACPVCKSVVRLEEQKIICIECGRKYPICNDIPVMLIDEAEKNEDR
jgi:uncharacterized protein YbaR (Trm112 family)